MVIRDELIEKLTLLYLERTCDISSMSVEDYSKKSLEVYVEVKKTLKENAPKSKWVY